MFRNISRLRRARTARQVLYGGSAVVPPTFLLQDDFLTDDASPIATPRSCEPGPGTLTFEGVDHWSILNDQLVSAGITVGEGFTAPSTARATGLAGAVQIAVSPSAKQACFCLLCSSQIFGFKFNSGTFYNLVSESAKNNSFPVFLHSVVNQWVMVCRSKGYYWLHKIGTGNWKLCAAIWQPSGPVAYTGAVQIYGGYMNGTSAKHEKLRFFQLASPWNSDFGIADTHQPNYTANTEILDECGWPG